MKNIYFLILSGGGGERLWPLSRKSRPKQFIAFLNGKTLLEQSVERISSLVQDKKFVGVVTTAYQANQVLSLMQDKIGFIIEEPTSRNTAPAVLYSCMKIIQQEKDAVLVFLPADSFVVQIDKYAKYLGRAIEYALVNNKIVTLGIMPTRPATGYGYIQANVAEKERVECGSFYEVFKFHEKPDTPLAVKYIKQNNMFWNISVFIAKASVFVEEFKTHATNIYSDMQKFLNGEIEYHNITSLSIDYAIMEKSKKVIVIPADFDWSDVGNLDVFLSLQSNLSTEKLKVINIDSKNNLVNIAPESLKKDKIIAFIGVDNLCLVEQEDVILVAKRSDVEKVKKVLAKMKEESLEEFL